MKEKSLAEIAKAFYLDHDDSEIPKTENMKEIRMINVLRAESYVLGGMRVIKSIKEILSRCDDKAFVKSLTNKFDLLIGDYQIEPKYKMGDKVKYKRDGMEGIGIIRNRRRDYCPATVESKIRYSIEGIYDYVFDEKDLKIAE